MGSVGGRECMGRGMYEVESHYEGMRSRGVYEVGSV